MCRSCYHKARYAAYPEKYNNIGRDKKAAVVYAVKYQAERRKSDPSFHLLVNLRVRLRQAIKNKQKTGSAINDLGCTIGELKQHLEKKFQSDWTWENYGKVWVIDHIKPLALFKLEDRNQFLEACNFTNLQPLGWLDNLKKGSYSHGC